MYNYNHGTYLMHHGVKGMKWGVRHDPERKGTGRKKKRKLTQAEKYDRAAKIAKVVAITAVAGLAVYGATKLGREYFDSSLKSGATLKVVADSATKNFGRAFYATDHKLDQLKYKGLFAGRQMGGSQGNDTFQYTIKNQGPDIKIAGKHNARKAFNELMKDPQFSKEVRPYLDSMKLGNKLNGHLLSDDYDAFNQGLVDHITPGHQKHIDMFYDKLKSMGYGGIKDRNDESYSGYAAKRAVIYFDKFSQLPASAPRRMDTKELQRAEKWGMRLVRAEASMPTVIGATAVLGAKKSKQYKNQAADARLREQKRKEKRRNGE